MADNDAKKPKIYGVKDIVEICGLDRNKVFYWSKTLKEIEPEYVTPGRQLFSLRSLLDFRLIFELQKMGLSPEHIKTMVLIEEDIDTEAGSFSRRFPVWDMFLKNRWKYEQKGYFLASRESVIAPPDRPVGSLDRSLGSYIEYFVGTADDVEGVVLRDMARDPFRMKNSIVVNLLQIIREVEEKTGESLE